MDNEFDIGGYATKFNIKCADDKTIRPGAFKDQHGKKVPIVWQHMLDTPENILGHAYLEYRDDGVYTHCKFNNNPRAIATKEAIGNGDLDSFSIYANKLVQKGLDVMHGIIREVSIVVAGANDGARIDAINFQHSDYANDDYTYDGIITSGPTEFDTEYELVHADEDDEDDEDEDEDETIEDILDTLNDKQKIAVYAVLGQTILNTTQEQEEVKQSATEHTSDEETSKAISHSNEQGNGKMSRRIFDQTETDEMKQTAMGGPSLSHSQIATIFEDAQKCGSFKEAYLMHAEDYGITNIEVLFPDAKAIDSKPEWITRKMEWVEKVLNGTRKLPWSKIKTMTADLTHEEARARGYIKGNLKKEQFFSVAFRTTGPQTIYKKQKLDKDDITDITDFDVVAWLWVEMRFMLREEIARAILVGDGRPVEDPEKPGQPNPDKIQEDKIRPIVFDDAFYTDVHVIPANTSTQGVVDQVLLAREKYKRSNPEAFMTQAQLTQLLLTRDRSGRRLWRTPAELASEMLVSSITPVPVLENVQHDDGTLLMAIVNLSDYAVGSTRGGEISTYDQFDIDYNQHKYLIEGRMSGALQHPKSAQIIVRATGTLVTPDVPTFNASTGVVTIPSKTGVKYYNDETDVLLTAGAQSAIAAGATIYVRAEADTNYYLPHNFINVWDYTRES